MTNPVVKIENFDIEKELACKCCGMYAYDPYFLMSLQLFRIGFNEQFGVTSGCRCEKHNKEVGGKPNSLHICEMKLASAIDITVNDLKRLYDSAYHSLLFNEIILYKNLNFVHLGIDPNQKGIYKAVV